jgi:hypothetical protein
MRGWIKLLLVLVLVALPIAGRWVWYYRGSYAPPVIPEIDESEIEVTLAEYRPMAVEAVEGVGRVVIDLAHQNNLEVDDLTPLQDRLTAYGVVSETFDGFTSSLEYELRGALALVIIAPTVEYTAWERDAIVDFVEDGGRLLLAADPTRPVPREEAELEGPEDLADILSRTSAIPAINSVANPLGVAFFDDYLYNLVENEGNYRNIKFTIFSDEHPLTQDLETLVFFAAHSLRSDGLSLISGDENTLSPLRSGETGLSAAALSADEQVLALGDATVLTAPYHTIADNDQFLSNIAEWLAAAERDWDLKDFPYLFRGPVDLVQVSGEYLDPRLITRAGILGEVFEEAGITLSVADTADPDNDTLFVGIFKNVESVEEYLDAAGVTITIVEAEEEEAAATPTPTPTVTGEEEPEEEPQDNIEIEGLGSIVAEGTSLFVVDRDAERVVLIVLAEDSDATMEAVERLVLGDFSGCVHHGDVTVCSTGEVEEGLGLDMVPEVPEEEPELPPEEEEEVAGPPTIASTTESQVALLAGTPWLEELAEESYDETSQAGETYFYTIVMEESQDVMWVYGWCAVTPEQLEENWENISLVFTLDGEEVSLDSFAEVEGPFADQECHLYYALLTDWPSGEHFLSTEVTFATELDDGSDIYPEGTHVYLYLVTVGG